MTLLAVTLAGLTILVVGILVGYLWGQADGEKIGYRSAYDEVERYYAKRERAQG